MPEPLAHYPTQRPVGVLTMTHLAIGCTASLLWPLLAGCDNGASGAAGGNDEDTTYPDDGGDHIINQDAGDNWIDDGSTVKGEANISVNVSLSPKIGTVGIVEWSIDKEHIDRAIIEFGPSTNYGFRVPVNLYSPSKRTLLLGMKPSREYHVRVVAREGDTRYESSDHTITTGPLANGLPPVQQQTYLDNEINGGFTIACTFSMGGSSSWVYILDKDGDYVWWYDPREGGVDCVRARMSYNGKYMYVANGNVPGPDNGTLVRVSMDGLTEESFDLPRRHHDITVLPDETVVYFEYDNSASGFSAQGCDRVRSLNPVTGEKSTIYVVENDFAALAGQHGCHSNAINYIPNKKAFSLSILNFNTLIMFDLSGDLLWTFGGPESDFTGASWDSQHQHYVEDNRVLLFNNNGNGGSSVIEYEIQGNRAVRSFEYNAGLTSLTMGDAKRLANGNTLITYSNIGIIREVNSRSELVQEFSFGSLGIGYTVRRPSLYGPPPEYL